jgi:DNA-binding NarL/FixJ family response regulator
VTGQPQQRVRVLVVDDHSLFRSGVRTEIEPAMEPELDQLTVREREVLRLIASGYTYKEAAARLHISARTVETHVSTVLRKLQLTSRRELSRWAAARNLA